MHRASLKDQPGTFPRRGSYEGSTKEGFHGLHNRGIPHVMLNRVFDGYGISQIPPNCDCMLCEL